jgi:hypothetical protein
MEDPACIFCLDSVSTRDKNPIPCECKYAYHRQCIQEWFAQKQQQECPICHAVCITVYVERTRVPNRACVGLCCAGLLVWVLIFVLFRNVLE